MRARYPWHAWLLLLAPGRVERGLERACQVGLVARAPSLWQLELGVLRMWHRVLFRGDTVGTCTDFPIRDTWRARLLAWRPLRFPFLLLERAVAPWDMSGFLSGPERIIRHLLAAHHDAQQFLYDLEMLTLYPGALGALRRRLAELLERDDARSRWLRDLTVYCRYHENLMAGLERFMAGEAAPPGAAGADPDISFRAYLSWCARQPESPAETWAAWRRGAWRLEPGLLEDG